MSRHYDRPITCTVNGVGQPQQFSWRGRQHRIVEIIDYWRETGEWWAGEPETAWYRVRTMNEGVYILYTPVAQPAWRLWKVFD